MVVGRLTYKVQSEVVSGIHLRSGCYEQPLAEKIKPSRPIGVITVITATIGNHGPPV